MFLQPIKGVFLSSKIDLRVQYENEFQSVSNLIDIRNPIEISDPSLIRFALCWDPDDDAFAPYPNLQMVSSIGAGVDNILKCSSLNNNTIVTRIRDKQQAFSMAGFIVWQVIWHHRRMKQYLLNESHHIWNWVESPSIEEYTVGVLGFGTMGQATAKALLSVGYKVIVACRSIHKKSKNKRLTIESGINSIQNTVKKSNILINLLPLTTATRFILNEDLFSLMPQGSILIQVGRGDHLVDEHLIKALNTGRLVAASLDVFSNEPLSNNNPFWDDPRIFITPHIACESDIKTVAKQVTFCIKDIINCKTPRYAINREREY